MASVIDHLVKKEQAQQLVVTTASEGEKPAMQKVVLVTLPGVTAEVDLDGGRAVVRAEQLPDDAALTSAVTEAGYKVVGIE